MKKGEADKVRLEHIISSADFILKHTQGKTENEFYQDDVLKYAVQKHIEIIGEAANFLSEDLHINYPEVDWKGIIGARNIYVHAYFNIIWTEVWEIVQNDIKPLKERIEVILIENTRR